MPTLAVIVCMECWCGWGDLVVSLLSRHFKTLPRLVGHVSWNLYCTEGQHRVFRGYKSAVADLQIWKHCKLGSFRLSSSTEVAVGGVKRKRGSERERILG